MITQIFTPKDFQTTYGEIASPVTAAAIANKRIAPLINATEIFLKFDARSSTFVELRDAQQALRSALAELGLGLVPTPVSERNVDR
jgi:hypothetical protein